MERVRGPAGALDRPAVRERVPAEGAIERGRRPAPARFDRPRFLTVFTGLVFVYFFAPIAVVFWFSFNSNRSVQTFRSFSLRWYGAFLHDPQLRASLLASIEIALVTMVVATAIGTLLAFGLVRSRSRIGRPTDVMMLLNVVTPEIVTGIAFLLLFSQLAIPLSLGTVTIGHITFSIAYVTIIVRARLAGLNRELEEAAMDLGATQLEAMRLVALPLLWPAVLASGLLVFVFSFDDFYTSFFTSGVGTPPLPLQIYSMIHFGVTPEINAVGTLMTVITISVVLLALLVYSRQQTRRLAFMAGD